MTQGNAMAGSPLCINGKNQPITRSTLVSRNIVVSAHRTSMRLEPEMWEALREICRREHATIHQICAHVAIQKQPNSSLTAAIRVYVMHYFRSAATEDGHARAGHGNKLGGTVISTRSYQSRSNAPLAKDSFL